MNPFLLILIYNININKNYKLNYINIIYMSNYFWTANGNYLKKNIIEKLSKGFIADDKGFCIDETCLTKEDMILIKEQVSYFSFFNSTINNKDILTNLEVKRYFTEVFKKIADANKPDANKPILEYISDYLVYGLNDEITNEIINLNVEYSKLDFYDFYIKSKNLIINQAEFKEDEIKKILESNRLDLNDKRARYVLVEEDVTAINAYYYITSIDDYTFILLKPKSLNYTWKILIYSNNIITTIIEEFTTKFNTKYNTEFTRISNINSNDEITKVQYRELIDNYKIISLSQGNNIFEIFKDKIFLKQYNEPLDLSSILTYEYFNNMFYDPNVFILNTFTDDRVAEIKIRLGNSVLNLSNKYYILDTKSGYNINLLRIKYNSLDNWKWQILYQNFHNITNN